MRSAADQRFSFSIQQLNGKAADQHKHQRGLFKYMVI